MQKLLEAKEKESTSTNFNSLTLRLSDRLGVLYQTSIWSFMAECSGAANGSTNGFLFGRVHSH